MTAPQLTTSEHRVLTQVLDRTNTLRSFLHALSVKCPVCSMTLGHACESEQPGIFVHAQRVAYAHRPVTVTAGQPITTEEQA